MAACAAGAAFGASAAGEAASGGGDAHAVRGRIAEASLIADHAAIAAGQPFRVALRLVLPDGWHTYWRNPGDAGAPTAVAWSLPPGFTAGPLDWPTPARFATGPVVSYGYEGEVWLMATLSPGPALPADGRTTLAAEAEWLVCADICIPEGARLALDLAVAPAPVPSAEAAAFAAAVETLPAPLPSPARASAAGDRLHLDIPLGADATATGSARFFPDRFGVIDNAAPQPLVPRPDGFRLVLTRAPATNAWPEVLEGVLAIEGGGRRAGYVVRTAIGS